MPPRDRVASVATPHSAVMPISGRLWMWRCRSNATNAAPMPQVALALLAALLR